MDYRELGGLAARIMQTAATNTFFGAAFYINMVETPARKSLKTADAMVDHFQATFPRARQQQGSLAAIATFSGLTGWYLDQSKEKDFLLAAVISTVLVLPWTKVVIMPINNLLMDGEAPKKKGDRWVMEMMTRWDRVHLVRTLASLTAASCLAIYWVKKTL